MLSMRRPPLPCSPSSPALPLKGTHPGTACAWTLFELLLIYLALCQFIFKCTESFKLLREKHQPKCFQQRLGLAEFLTILKLIQNSFGRVYSHVERCGCQIYTCQNSYLPLFLQKETVFFVFQGQLYQMLERSYCHTNKMHKSPFSLPAWEFTAAESRDWHKEESPCVLLVLEITLK